jgi:hypothetical protein
MCATCFAHPVLLNLLIIILHEDYVLPFRFVPNHPVALFEAK